MVCLCGRSCAEIVSAISSSSDNDKYADPEREQQDFHLMQREVDEWVRLGKLLLEMLKTGYPEEPAQEEEKEEDKEGEKEEADQKTSGGGEVQEMVEVEGKAEEESEMETKTSTSSKGGWGGGILLAGSTSLQTCTIYCLTDLLFGCIPYE